MIVLNYRLVTNKGNNSESDLTLDTCWNFVCDGWAGLVGCLLNMVLAGSPHALRSAYGQCPHSHC